MNKENIKLIDPTQKLWDEYIDFAEELYAAGEKVIHGIGSIDKDNFTVSLQLAKDHAKGISLPEGWVPASTYWLICQRRIIGTCNIRHHLTEALKKFGGHIGYSIRPSERGKGYGTQMLKLALEKAQALGIKRALVTCGDNNIASARVIEKNNGQLEDKMILEDREVPTRRYWIELT